MRENLLGQLNASYKNTIHSNYLKDEIHKHTNKLTNQKNLMNQNTNDSQQNNFSLRNRE